MGYIIPDWNRGKYDRRMDEGRGQDSGKQYLPWINIQDGPKGGRRTRDLGWKTNRIHHLLSDNETRYFYILEWLDFVIDIREQYPLLDYERAMYIAKKAGIEYPLGVDGFPHILTTDFLITVLRDGRKVNIARTVKPKTHLDKKSTIELFEIERQYWNEQDVNWGIVTDADLPEIFCRNVELVHSEYRLIRKGMSSSELSFHAEGLLERLLISKGKLREVCSSYDYEMNLDPGVALQIVKHLIANKKITIDMFKELDTAMPVTELTFNERGTQMNARRA